MTIADRILIRGVTLSRRAWALTFLLLTACASQPPEPHTPPPWPAAIAAPDQSRVLPLGLFANRGESATADYAAPALTALVFKDGLAGFPVESVLITTTADQGQLVFQGVLAGVPLQQKALIESSKGRYQRAWHGANDSGEVNATLRTGALLWTGGLLMPISQKYRFTLDLTSNGDLLVFLQVRDKTLGALIVPVTTTEEYWLRYPRLPAQQAFPEPPQ